MTNRCHIAGVALDPVTMDESMERIAAFIRCGDTHQVATVNLDFLRLARRNTQFRDVLNEAQLTVADGMPLVWLARFSQTRLPQRVAGVEIVERTAALAAQEGYSIFLLGAAPGIADAAAGELQRRQPGLQIAGAYSPPIGPFTPEEDAHMVELIRAARPQILLVAFGAPRQDLWIAEHQSQLEVPVCIGVGGSFDIIAGRLPRAPGWMQKTGFEWLYRLQHEPARLWRRYLLGDLPLLVRIASSLVLPAALFGNETR